MEPRNDAIYTVNNRLHSNSAAGIPGYLGNQLLIRQAELQQYTTQRPRPLLANKLKKNPRIKTPKRKPIQRRQFFRPGPVAGQRPQQQPVARNALQMSLLLLSLLAFGTFATTSIMMRSRRSNRREQSAYRILINKTPRVEEISNNSTNTSFTYWASVFTRCLFEFITDFVQDL